jgi:pimeloyl-ACP methyl ester carboxylesterase
VTANAKMLREMLDALHIDQVDLIGNDSGGGIAQIFAALNPDRVRTLTLTNYDAHDNWPPEAFKPFVDMVAGGGLRDTLNVLLTDKTVYRSQEALGPAYERPEKVTDEDIETYLRPFVRNDQRTLDLARFVTSFDNKHTVSIAPKLRALRASTLIVWATDDIYFPVKWAYWLAGAIPGAKPPVELEGARLFFPEERARDFNRLLRDHLLNGWESEGLNRRTYRQQIDRS